MPQRQVRTMQNCAVNRRLHSAVLGGGLLRFVVVVVHIPVAAQRPGFTAVNMQRQVSAVCNGKQCRKPQIFHSCQPAARTPLPLSPSPPLRPPSPPPTHHHPPPPPPPPSPHTLLSQVRLKSCCVCWEAFATKDKLRGTPTQLETHNLDDGFFVEEGSLTATFSQDLCTQFIEMFPSCAALFCVRTFLLTLRLLWGMRKHHPVVLAIVKNLYMLSSRDFAFRGSGAHVFVAECEPFCPL